MRGGRCAVVAGFFFRTAIKDGVQRPLRLDGNPRAERKLRRHHTIDDDRAGRVREAPYEVLRDTGPVGNAVYIESYGANPFIGGLSKKFQKDIFIRNLVIIFGYIPLFTNVEGKSVLKK